MGVAGDGGGGERSGGSPTNEKLHKGKASASWGGNSSSSQVSGRGRLGAHLCSMNHHYDHRQLWGGGQLCLSGQVPSSNVPNEGSKRTHRVPTWRAHINRCAMCSGVRFNLNEFVMVSYPFQTTTNQMETERHEKKG